ncbi:hypothetical protein [Mycobacterium paraffinicum]|uniref:hypothetical protein n=1 Tax=Mycobacterium paraffinicum TaxID=53378 RepID=UPI0021F2D28E|nr:hypothetical protein [Mycobacterium paraffinicum]
MSETTSAPQNVASSRSPVPGTPSAPWMSMTLPKKNVNGITKKNSVSHVWIS